MHKYFSLFFILLFVGCTAHVPEQVKTIEKPATQPVVEAPVPAPVEVAPQPEVPVAPNKPNISLNIPKSEEKPMETNTVVLQTNKGDIVIELFEDMPITAGNFKKLVSKRFYDGVIFHRVIKGFMIQGGDPDGTGMGGSGYTIKDEFTDHNRNDRGTISMANSGPNTGGSQFFLNLVNNNFLDSKHPAFGKIIEGMEIVDSIAQVKTGANDRPVEEVKIVKATFR